MSGPSRKGWWRSTHTRTGLGACRQRDSRFTFWLPVRDLRGRVGRDRPDSGLLDMPRGEHNDADWFELRSATSPITIESWDQATSYAGNPIMPAPGEPVAVGIGGLDQGRDYFVAIRTWTRGRPEPILSNIAQATTERISDTTAPAMIDDLRASAVGQSWIQLAWTAVGDDGSSGSAAHTLIRILIDDTIEDETDWGRAMAVSGLGTPRPPGSAETFAVQGLVAGRTFGIAVRAQDEVGLLSPLHPPYSARTADLPPPPPPDQDRSSHHCRCRRRCERSRSDPHSVERTG